MGKLMERLYDDIDKARAFAISFTNFVYMYDDLCFDDFNILACKRCSKYIQTKDYLYPRASCKKNTGILHTLDFGVSPELRNELIARFDITEDDFRPIWSKRGELVYYQITPQHKMLPIHEVNNWSVVRTCRKCRSVQYDCELLDNEKEEPYGYISQAALDEMHDLNVTYESFDRHTPYYMISRRVYDFLTEKYPRTHYFPFFLK